MKMEEDDKLNNVLTKEDIKNSLEYQWRKYQIKVFMIIWAIIVFFTILVTLVVGLKNILLTLKITIGIVVSYSLVFLPFPIYYLYKLVYFLKKAPEFSVHEVILENVSTSFWYRGYIYYSVSIVVDNKKVGADTNPYFSNSSLLAKFYPKDYNNKKVIGLYDSRLEKFYVIKKTQ